jgi:trehalose 6-phosphate phosphatase
VTAPADVLSPHHRPILAGFALSNVLLAFDYDGTLAPIATTPAAAQMRSTTGRLLARASRRYPCVVISGRMLADISERVQEIPLWYVFGNHGFEPVNPNTPPTGRTAEWLRTLREQLPAQPGIVIEDKSHTLTIHYRAAPDRESAAAAIGRAVQSLTDARVVGGAEAVNVLPRNGADKGVALRHAMRLFACTTAIYVGDDDTDEDAFRAIGPDRLLGVRIGRSDSSAAGFHLENQTDIDALLRILVDLRSTQFSTRPEDGGTNDRHNTTSGADEGKPRSPEDTHE